MALLEQDTWAYQKPFVDSGKVSTGLSLGEMLRTSAAVVTSVQRTKVPQISLVPSFSSWLWGAPMERVAVDIMGPFPRTDKGNRYVPLGPHITSLLYSKTDS